MPTSRPRSTQPDLPQLDLGPTPESNVASARNAVVSVLVALLVLVLCGVFALLYLSWSVERDIENHDGSIDVVGENPVRDGALPDRLADDERMEATVRVDVPPRTPFLNSDLSIADGYETIYMKLGLDA